ncbi:hypothetical protein B7M42_22095 [Salmonella enterica subsp. enterica serovar Newport]|nr:hypothetical protein [Salmonella enterica subsp. enterica serovar Newport]
MTLKFTELDANDRADRMRVIGHAARAFSKDAKTGICVASLQALTKDGWRVGEMISSESTPAASAYLHAERGAYIFFVERLIALNLLTAPPSFHLPALQSTPRLASIHFHSIGIARLDCFCELPPCDDCLKWWKDVDEGFNGGKGIIEIKYIDQFGDKYGSTPEERLLGKKGEPSRNADKDFHLYVKNFK